MPWDEYKVMLSHALRICFAPAWRKQQLITKKMCDDMPHRSFRILVN
jgi:hypothetical protein